MPEQLSNPRLGAQLTHQTSRMPGAATGKLGLLQEEYIAPSELGEVISGGASHDATTHHYDPGLRGEWGLSHERDERYSCVLLKE